MNKYGRWSQITKETTCPLTMTKLTDRQALEEWKDEMYMSKVLDDDVCPK